MIRCMMALAIAATLAPTVARAQDRPASTAGAAPAASTRDGEAFREAAISEADLGKVAGREDVARSSAIASQRNTVANNSVTGNSVTGNVVLDGNAFQNLQGLAVINANSGNNVAINSAMNVIVNMAPAR